MPYDTSRIHYSFFTEEVLTLSGGQVLTTACRYFTKLDFTLVLCFYSLDYCSVHIFCAYCSLFCIFNLHLPVLLCVASWISDGRSDIFILTVYKLHRGMTVKTYSTWHLEKPIFWMRSLENLFKQVHNPYLNELYLKYKYWCNFWTLAGNFEYTP